MKKKTMIVIGIMAVSFMGSVVHADSRTAGIKQFQRSIFSKTGAQPVLDSENICEARLEETEAKLEENEARIRELEGQIRHMICAKRCSQYSDSSFEGSGCIWSCNNSEIQRAVSRWN